MESVSGSDVRLRRVAVVGLGNRARQEFASGMHRHVVLSRESLHGALLQGTVSGHGKSSRAGGADGAMAQGHGTSLPSTAWTWHCDTGVHMGIIVKFSEALPCVKSPVSRTAGRIYVVT